jgi:transmembrane sensor
LLAEADRARLAGRFEEGAALLQRLLRDHPADPRAPVAAFSLGRVLLGELGRPAEAAAAFERARVLAPHGPLAEDALAREVEAWSRAGEPARARARADDYLRAYPNGRRAAAVNDAVRSNR